MRQRSRLLLGLLAAATGLQLAPGAPVAGAYERPGPIQRISVNAAGEGDGSTGSGWKTAISADGRYVAFESRDDTLKPGDHYSAGPDIFVRDNLRGTIQIASLASDGSQPLLEGVAGEEPGHFAPSLSADGRYVAFHSSERLSPRDINLVYDVYVRDLAAGRTILISDPSADAGPELNELGALILGGRFPSMSGNGRYVAFEGRLPLDSDGASTGLFRPAVFVRDMRTGRTLLASVDDDGEVANHWSQVPQISHTGRYVAFQSLATNLSDKDSSHPICVFNGGSCWDIYLHDRKARSTELISRGRDGNSANGDSYLGVSSQSTISANGRFVAYSSGATNIIPDHSEQGVDTEPLATGGVYVLDRKTDRVRRVSVDSAGRGISGGGTRSISLTSDGRYVSFVSFQSDPPLTTTSEATVHDLWTGATEMTTESEIEGPGKADDVSLSGDGRYVALASENALTDGDDNEEEDIYLRDRGRSLGVGDLLRSSRLSVGDVTFARRGLVTASDADDDAFEGFPGSELLGASIAYRPKERDLFAAIEFEAHPFGLGLPGTDFPLLYGLRFETKGKRYEARALPSGQGGIRLYDCTRTCREVADLNGGYGTTGFRTVFAIPLATIGVEHGGKIAGIEAFSGLGSGAGEVAVIFDALRFSDDD